MSEKQTDPQLMQERLLFGGLTALFSVLGLAMPLFIYIAPIPLGMLAYTQGMRVATIAAVISGVLTGVFVHPLGLMVVLLLLALGLAIGGGLRENIAPIHLLLVGTVVNLISFGALIMTTQNIFDVNVIDDMFEQWTQMAGAEFEQVFAMARPIFPAMMIMSSTVITFLNMYGVHRFLKRRGIDTAWFPPFRQWRFSRWLAVAFLTLYVLDIIVLPTGIAVVFSNLLAIAFYALIVQGISIVMYFAHEWGWPRPFLILLILFVVFVQLGQIGMLLLALADAIFHFRKDNTNHENGNAMTNGPSDVL